MSTEYLDNISDEMIIEIIRPYMLEADGGYVVDYPDSRKLLVQGIREVIRYASGQAMPDN